MKKYLSFKITTYSLITTTGCKLYKEIIKREIPITTLTKKITEFKTPTPTKIEVKTITSIPKSTHISELNNEKIIIVTPTPNIKNNNQEKNNETYEENEKIIKPTPTPSINSTAIYTVKSGDTLWKIAQKFNTSINKLKQLNKLNSNLLTIGQRLQISEKTITFDPSPTPKNKINYEEYANEIIKCKNLTYFHEDKLDRYITYKIKNNKYSWEKVIMYVNIGIDQPFYSNIKIINDTNKIDNIINKYNKLPDNFVPELVFIEPSMCHTDRNQQKVRADVKEAFVKMYNDAIKLGLNIIAYGTYRSINTQKQIWNREVNKGRTIEDVDSLNSRGGHSEHHTGAAIDVIYNDYYFENKNKQKICFIETNEYKWYSINAHKYGFIIRYQPGKEYITGYNNEPWHLRYLGIPLATFLYNTKLTLEEYHALEINNCYINNIPLINFLYNNKLTLDQFYKNNENIPQKVKEILFILGKIDKQILYLNNTNNNKNINPKEKQLIKQ